MAAGGRYLIDPETGEARLVDRTEPAPAPWEVQSPSAPAQRPENAEDPPPAAPDPAEEE